MDGVDQVMRLVQIGTQLADLAAIARRRSALAPLRFLQARRHVLHVPPQLTEKGLSLCGVGGVVHVTDRAICVSVPLTSPDLD